MSEMKFVPIVPKGHAVEYECVHGRHIVLVKWGFNDMPYIVWELDDNGEFVEGSSAVYYSDTEALWGFWNRTVAIRQFPKSWIVTEKNDD